MCVCECVRDDTVPAEGHGTNFYDLLKMIRLAMIGGVCVCVCVRELQCVVSVITHTNNVLLAGSPEVNTKDTL